MIVIRRTKVRERKRHCNSFSVLLSRARCRSNVFLPYRYGRENFTRQTDHWGGSALICSRASRSWVLYAKPYVLQSKK